MRQLLKKIALSILPEKLLSELKKVHYIKTLRNISEENEPDLKVVKVLVQEGDFVMDIGANIGVYAKCLSGMVGEKGKVWSFEPIPQTFEILKSNIKKLGLKNVDLFNYAISDENRSVQMEIPSYETGGKNYYEAHIVNANEINSKRQIKVEAKTVDFLCSKSTHPIAFIKCDVEGNEFRCVKGAVGLIMRLKPSWLIEVSGNPDARSSTAYELFQLLCEYGYMAFWFDGIRLRMRIKGDNSVNYFFLTEEHIYKIKKSNLVAL